jgi:hypothetical protein
LILLFWSLTPLSAIFQLYHGDQFQWWKNPEYPERTTDHGQATGKLSFSIQSCRSCYARLYLCQRPFYKILVKVRNSKKYVLKIVLIIVNINKDENKSLISNQFSLKNLKKLFCGGIN